MGYILSHASNVQQYQTNYALRKKQIRNFNVQQAPWKPLPRECNQVILSRDLVHYDGHFQFHTESKVEYKINNIEQPEIERVYYCVLYYVIVDSGANLFTLDTVRAEDDESSRRIREALGAVEGLRPEVADQVVKIS